LIDRSDHTPQSKPSTYNQSTTGPDTKPGPVTKSYLTSGPKSPDYVKPTMKSPDYVKPATKVTFLNVFAAEFDFKFIDANLHGDRQISDSGTQKSPGFPPRQLIGG